MDILHRQFQRQYQTWSDATRRQAMAEAYRPIVRGFLLPGCAYYLFVTWGHWRDETGSNLVILGGISLATVIAYAIFRTFLLPEGRTTLAWLEAVGLAANLLLYSNVLAYMLLHLEEQKLVYFVLIAVVFSTSGVTLRATVACVILSIGTLIWFARGASPALAEQYAFIGVATSFASVGMATLLRKAILRQIDARLLADRMALRDGQTGIANRRAIFGCMDELVRDRKPFWIGILDLDGFKAINDIYGHAVGDSVLCEVVARLEGHASADVRFGRIGGDEFAILVVGEATAEEVEGLGDQLIAEIGRTCEIAFLKLAIGGTIGFAHFPEMGPTTREIFEKADYALYRGKEQARGRTVIFTMNEDRRMRDSLSLERGLREADLETELHLLFQPQMNVVDGRVRSFEALARWQSPALGAVPPDRFIRAAERAGLIQNVTRILFRKGLDALETWPPDVNVSFNLSAQDIADRAFILSLVAQVLHREIDPARIEFEITETAVMKHIGDSRLLLEDLSALGFRIALDDFGSGYSSFEYIDQLPLDKIKIDKSFVRKVSTSAASREIVAALIKLCRNLDLECVLEGVETEEEMAILAPLSPRIIQGYLFGRPMPSKMVVAMFARDGGPDERSASA
jgi:diguanylate cyclase (GGDEF)-like protein